MHRLAFAIFLLLWVTTPIEAANNDTLSIAADTFINQFDPWSLPALKNVSNKTETNKADTDLLRHIKRYPLRERVKQQVLMRFTAEELSVLTALMATSHNRTSIDNFMYFYFDIRSQLVSSSINHNAYLKRHSLRNQQAPPSASRIHAFIYKVKFQAFVSDAINQWRGCTRAIVFRQNIEPSDYPNVRCSNAPLKGENPEKEFQNYDENKRRLSVNAYIESHLGAYFGTRNLIAIETFFTHAKGNGWSLIDKYGEFFGIANAYAHEAVEVGTNSWRKWQRSQAKSSAPQKPLTDYLTRPILKLPHK